MYIVCICIVYSTYYVIIHRLCIEREEDFAGYTSVHQAWFVAYFARFACKYIYVVTMQVVDLTLEMSLEEMDS